MSFSSHKTTDKSFEAARAPEHTLSETELTRRAIMHTALDFLLGMAFTQFPDLAQQLYDGPVSEAVPGQAPAASEVVGQGAMQQTVQITPQPTPQMTTQPQAGREGYALAA